ncbi:MAG: hypothetical protein V1816_00190 [Pseudomonadota bacterium]
MSGELLVGWKPFILTLTTIAFIYVVNMYAQRLEKRRFISDDEFLWRFARINNCSEYDVFLLAIEDWSISGTQVEADFRDYLLQGDIPHYVRHFIRKHKDFLLRKRVPGFFPS